MTPEQFEKEKSYRVMMAIATTMLNKGLITDQDYKKIDRLMLEKYRPLLSVLGL